MATAKKKAAAKKTSTKKATRGVTATTKGKRNVTTTTGPATTATKVEGLRKPQVRVLEALAKSSRALNRAEIAEKAEVDLAFLNSYIGAHDEKVRAKNDKRFKSLLTLGYVKHAPAEGDGRGSYYTITAAGRKAIGA